MTEILLAFLMHATPETCLSTMYGYDGDRYYGGDTIWFQRHPKYDHGVAHRSLPLGSWLVVENPRNNKRLILRVTDRGPYWALDKDNNGFIKLGKNKDRQGKYRGCLDITIGAGRELGHTGLQRVKYYRVPPKSNLARALNRKHGCNPPRPPKWWRARKCHK